MVNVRELRKFLDEQESTWTDKDSYYLGEFEYQAVVVPYFSLDGKGKFQGYGPFNIYHDMTGLGYIIEQRPAFDEKLNMYNTHMKWFPIGTADFESESLNLVYWEDGYITLEDFCHDDTADWWKERGAVLFQEVELPETGEVIE